MKKLLALFLTLSLMMLLVACGNTAAPPSEAPEDTTSAEDTALPEDDPTPEIQIAPMNDLNTILESMDTILKPVYVYYKENDLVRDKNKLTVLKGFDERGSEFLLKDYTPNEGGLWKTDYREWTIDGHGVIKFDGNKEVVLVDFNINYDHELWGGMSNAYILAQAVFSSSVQGVTPEMGTKIANALHLNDGDYVMPEGKRFRAVEHEGYVYIADQEPTSIYIGFSVRATDGYYQWEPDAKTIIFDLDGNQL
ncbi:MAG: hypothetical protein LBB42_03705 [Coriobacteriales bacterium]|jgi:hypothetical protein|nr:hypothetical protein [Coriobacteriales bacterium]